MEKDPRKAATPAKGPANAGTRVTMNRIQSRERKLALQQDVDKLKKKLRHEENVHRALERAFTRPLGALPRLPPYLPSQTLALLAEVAVLEEEVVRLEEQVVSFRQGIYQEAIIFSSTKNAQLPDGQVPVPAQLVPSYPVLNSEVSPATVSQGPPDHPPGARPSPHSGVANGKQTPRNPVATSPSQDDRSGAGKENQSCSNTPSTSSRQSPSQQKTPKCRATPPDRRRVTPAQMVFASSMQTSPAVAPDRKRPADAAAGTGSNSDNVTTSHDDASSSVPNKVSEELLRCLLAIFSQMGGSAAGGGRGLGDEDQQALSPSVSGSSESSASSEADAYPQDPYGILELGARDIGAYKRFHVVDAASFDGNGDTPLVRRRLKALLRRLSSVDLAGLSHQQKLAFWINVYNSCMMNAFLEHGIPTTPQMLVAMMPKATVSVGGRTHSAMSIEHFILRLPYSAKQVKVSREGAKCDDGDVTAARGAFGLEWPEPLVTFALSCGSWSSPAVRVYTAARVEEELEAAKREYLQAAAGVWAAGRLAVPKLLHWYLLDFAKDVDALMDWVCLQLPPELRQEAVRAVEVGRRAGAGGRVRVLPYEFRFRYLLAS
ncbi:uncharacterized protein [Zea mays]|uniref:Ternary complex factor MIP1-like protein n=2 Tax=Zea mays TaxID=4577 RepID=A0A1D6ERJ4_MAIZE|nr:uncharacterized protein LOC103647498 isoform X3 [Zea mays]XP_008670253.1 uncharacterized protein LOC103647498 isoform X3 [Zea mays]XP_035821313.1 uncharacterized protein LOC103647498 isoform X3 [Zea mays]ONM22357.1 Ternary complex factor MIP1-like protein [Zea mays]|eukprot:XP_008670252.1 uncharacterized protein LOC103647498 isoform X3 [Zea mays]